MAFKTCDEALKWLAKIGGKLQGPSRKTEDLDMVVVGIPGHRLTRMGLIDNALKGAAREKAVEDAILDACNEFRNAGAERLATGR